ncbi:MAG: Arm DNA-binding domain-containing protein, partial [Deltaproteobacteria bacterium]|nr:Arm DNA-binding domain-containing protein [Deltaproteobacteria bacterium]
MGPFPAVSLKMAREKRDEAKELLARGVDTGEMKKKMKQGIRRQRRRQLRGRCPRMPSSERPKKPNKAKGDWTERHSAQVIARLEKNVFPFIGKYPSATSRPPTCRVCCGASRTGRPMSLRTASCRYAGRSAATPSPPAAPSGTWSSTSRAPLPRTRRNTTPPLPRRRRSAACF